MISLIQNKSSVDRNHTHTPYLSHTMKTIFNDRIPLETFKLHLFTVCVMTYTHRSEDNLWDTACLGYEAERQAPLHSEPSHRPTFWNILLKFKKYLRYGLLEASYAESINNI